LHVPSFSEEEIMRLVRALTFTTAAALLIMPTLLNAQRGGEAAGQMDADRSVAGGGISVAGWQGKIDSRSAQQGMTINDSKFAQEGNALHLTIGPPAIYWNPSHTATGTYTVKATFREPRQTYSHAHPFGIFIGGQNLDNDQQRFTYCAAYRNGTFIVRQFNGTEVRNLVPAGRGTQPHAAVRNVDAASEVVQEVGWNVKGGTAECVVNGQVVATLTPEQLGGAGATDGIYGIRVAHNVDVIVTNLAKN
jgi:hypothetical protein